MTSFFRFFIFTLIQITSLSAICKTLVKCILPSAHLPPHVIGESVQFAEPFPGLTVEGLRLIFSKHPDVELRLERIPFNRMSAGIKNGEYDCTVSIDLPIKDKDNHIVSRVHRPPLTSNGQVDETRLFSRSGMYIYSNKVKPVHWDGKQLKPNKPVYSAIKEFSHLAEQKGLQVITENLDLKRQIKQLEGNRIEALIALESLADPIVKETVPSLIIKSPTPVVEINNYLVFSNKFYERHSELCEKIWDTTKNYRNSPEFRKIKKHYLN